MFSRPRRTARARPRLGTASPAPAAPPVSRLPDAGPHRKTKGVIQRPIVHFIRNSLSFVSYKERKAVALALKEVYRAADAEVAAKARPSTRAPGAKKYPAIAMTWRRHWGEVVPFFAFPDGIRRIVYTTDEIDKPECCWRAAGRRDLRRVWRHRGLARTISLVTSDGSSRVWCCSGAITGAVGSRAGGPSSRPILPALDGVLVGPLGLLGEGHLLCPQRLDVVGIGGAAPTDSPANGMDRLLPPADSLEGLSR